MLTSYCIGVAVVNVFIELILGFLLVLEIEVIVFCFCFNIIVIVRDQNQKFRTNYLTDFELELLFRLYWGISVKLLRGLIFLMRNPFISFQCLILII